MEVIEAGNKNTVRNWASTLEPQVIEQAKMSARCCAVSGPIALMPDAHFGRGATVGSVIPTKSAIIPAAVGVDIGCGMIAAKLNITASDLPDSLDSLLSDIGRSIPAGFHSHKNSKWTALTWMKNNPIPDTSIVKDKVLQRCTKQLGTLGGGNHFVEICIEQDAHSSNGDQGVWFVLHSGSRGIGNAVAQHYIRDAKALCVDLERALEDKDLAYYLQSDLGFQEYITSMLWAQDYALENREIMLSSLLRSFNYQLFGNFEDSVKFEKKINCHHNYTTKETHDGEEIWVTRKGAIRAGVDDWGVIPGSMGQRSYVVTGLGNSDSYKSASHGAGRNFSRTKAKKEFTVEQFEAAMDNGVTWQKSNSKALLDESPMAYKDIDVVMEDQKDLVQIQYELKAILNYKGV